MTREEAVERLPELLRELTFARNAFYESTVAELSARAATLRARLTAGETAASTERWAEVDAVTHSVDKLRNRAKMEALIDERDFLLAVVRGPDAEDREAR